MKVRSHSTDDTNKDDRVLRARVGPGGFSMNLPQTKTDAG